MARVPQTKTKRRSVRLLDAITEKLASDPAAPAFLRSQFIRTVLNNFVAVGAPIETTRAISHRLNCKTDPDTITVSLPLHEFNHFKQYAKVNGGHNFNALIVSALAYHYFGPAQVNAAACASCAPSRISVFSNWRSALQALSLGETREFTRRDIPTTLFRARQAAHETAEIIREAIPEFRISTRRTQRCLFITRLS